MLTAQNKLAASFLALASTALAQTYSSCNPTTNTSCPADAGLNSASYTVDFTQGADDANWASTGTGNVTYGSLGAEFTIPSKGYSPTIATNWYIFFGRIEVIMRAANGTGIVSSLVVESDDLDEIDWEWLGGDTTQAETNYFGKGNTTSYDRATYETVSTPQDTFHNYTIDWTSSAISWYIDGTLKRTLNYDDAVSGTNFPQTPSNIRIGIWAGGDSSEPAGTIEWAGGETDYSTAPFTMYVQSVSVYNYNPACSYTYGDQTGDYSSIEMNTDCSSSSDTTTDTTTSSSPSSSASASSSSSSSTGSSNSINSSNSSNTSSSSSTTTTTSPAKVATTATSGSTSASTPSVVPASGGHSLAKVSGYGAGFVLAVSAALLF